MFILVSFCLSFGSTNSNRAQRYCLLLFLFFKQLPQLMTMDVVKNI